MVNVLINSLISVLIVSMVSFIGILTFLVNEKKLKRMTIYLVSFSAGALFGDAFIHMLPETVEKVGFGINTSLFIMVGIISFFILEKIINWHHYHYSHTKEQTHPFVFTNLIGDASHNFIDGLIIAASYLVSTSVGIATTVAVVLHEMPQEIGDLGILLHAGFSKGKALLFNFVTALMAVLGAIVSLILASYAEGMIFILIPFAVGGFIYVAGSDLIPELHKEIEIKKSLLQLLAFILGISIMAVMLLL